MTASSPSLPPTIDPALTAVDNESSSSPSAQAQPPASSAYNPFPAHSHPRVWFLSAGNTPVAVILARALLEHGDKVVAGVYPPEHERAETRKDDFRGLLRQVQLNKGWKERFKIVAFDIRYVWDGSKQRSACCGESKLEFATADAINGQVNGRMSGCCG